MPLLLLTLLACRPYADVEAREVGWYTPEGVAAQGIELAPLPAGQPLGHWPRVTLSLDAAGIDNRAWFLALEPALLADRAAAEAWLVEAPAAQPLDAGRAPDDRHRMLVDGLYDVASDIADIGRDLHLDGAGPEPPTRVVVVPDRRVPWETVLGALYTTAQASLMGAYAIAGAHDGHVRSAIVGPAPADPACPVALRVERAAAGTTLAVGPGPPVAAPGGGCVLDDGALQAAAARITTTCAGRGVACAEVYASADDALSAGDVLGTLATLTALHPAVVYGPLLAQAEPLAPGACALAIDLDHVDDAGWAWLCAQHRVVEAADLAQDPGLARTRRIHPLSDHRGLAGAFPAWGAWLDAETTRHNRRAAGLPELE